MPAGRPSTYDPSICADLPGMFRNGESKLEVAVALDIAETTFYEWVKKYPEFAKAVKKGEELSRAWWESEGRASLRDKDFNATLWYMNMKNRHGWKDRQDITSGDKPLTINRTVFAEPEDECPTK